MLHGANIKESQLQRRKGSACNIVSCLIEYALVYDTLVVIYTISSPVFTTATFSVLWNGMKAETTAITKAVISK